METYVEHAQQSPNGPLSLVEDEQSVTRIVEAAMANTSDPRLRFVMGALVRHLHAFLREARLTDAEFEFALEFVARLGQATHATHNEVVLAADVLGLSTLVTVMNNGTRHGRTPGALLGPFYRASAPRYACGDCVVQDNPPGLPLFVSGTVRATDGTPLSGALVEIWQASPVGLYDNQDPSQPDRNLRGCFHADEGGHYHFRSVRPAGYPVPTDGPVGTLLAAQRRHPYRPAHIHFIVAAPGYRTLVTQVFADEPAQLASDVTFGVHRQLVGQLQRHDQGYSPWGDVPAPFFTLEFDFTLEPGEQTFPKPPID
ncbi:hydroxyquinol 1,2-dioxygenase [Cupriavidus phytorum]|uniref:Hydroxyquinol 1,2-dioxygenase n=2 Tax=Cupriavidus TaxID=106589 RepID=A0A976A9T7_9BURK|nr:MULTISPECIES: dioxygenase [Cupriavidus]PZX34600.1 catechol 1,2-dioxygenase [Cupriavidus alkaliphilus]SOY71276.1 hydroxyquinol 1,2-dioxygenase [Cupriavidus taiwanensis]